MNPFTEMFLESMQAGSGRGWRFLPMLDEKPTGDYEVTLSSEPDEAFPDGGRTDGQRQDYGLIVRGPHPRHPNRMVTIMAGPHSLGTGAACMAATRSQLVNEIKQRFFGHDRPYYTRQVVLGVSESHLWPR